MNKYCYISSLDTNKIKLYTLQLANMKRIEENDAVYIFDEVGSGKTISAGLATIQLLFQHEDISKFNNVLIITAPSVVEQFANKFENILELKIGEDGVYNKKNYNIQITNYDYRNIEKEIYENYDLIIVDEAHEFLNKETRRYKELIKLKSKKILFMTATPIKYLKSDLNVYPEIAAQILQKNYEQLKSSLIDACANKKELSGSFNPKSPVSRYFKETVRNIEKTEDGQEFMNKEPRRLIPELWEYDSNQDINLFLAEQIDKKSSGDNRFVVFVRYIKNTTEIAEALKNIGFNDYLTSSNSEKSFCIITGGTENRKFLLQKFSKTNSELPKVLIVTYKISEQGIDLPAYNYTINYHISASPSQLEQRFGRIDRLNSIHNELNTCFILKRNSYADINTANFYTAVATYINQFLPLIPTKNCLITYKILESFTENNSYIISYYERLKNKCMDYSILIEVFNKVLSNESVYEWDSLDYDLLSFIEDRNIEFAEDIEVFKKNILREIEKCINQSQKSQGRIHWWKENIDLLSNELFYIDTEEEQFDWSKKYNIETINPKDVARDITLCSLYSSFSEEVKKPIEIMRIWNSKKNIIEQEIENKFHENKFSKIFPKTSGFGWIRYLYFSKEKNIVSEEIINELVSTLPFYKMCNEFKNIIQSFAYKSGHSLYQKYDFDPFDSSISQVYSKRIDLNLSPSFFNSYIDEEKGFLKPYHIKNVNDVIISSNWLKLFYMYSGREAFAIANLKDNVRIKDYSDPNLIYVTSGDRIVKGICLKVDSLYFIMKEHAGTNIEKTNRENIETYFKCVWSLFRHFLFTFSGNRRLNTENAIYTEGSIYNSKNLDDRITGEIIRSYFDEEGLY